MAGLTIDAVTPGSIADAFEVEAGDRLLAVNGRPLRDVIDYSYYTASESELLLELEKSDGDIWELEVERSGGEPLGLSFSPPSPARCANNCLFCFVHQLPKGLRRPLYVKDEDYRLSFLNGTYVTLANLKDSELKRIVEQRLSPLYVSVHATHPALRERLLGKQGIPPILDQLKRLADARISLHTQVVLCPGLNDGGELVRTVDDLAGLFPAVQSLAIVPLGLTRHRERLPLLTPVDPAYAREFVETWQPEAVRIRKRLRHPFLFLADEFFLKAGLPFPPIRQYGDFPQIENGVGMVPLFMRDAARTLRRARPLKRLRAVAVTGVSSSGFVSDFLASLSERCGGEFRALPVSNRLFGASVTVSGLVAGADILAALEGQEPGDCLLVPDVMLKEGEGLFLDGISCAELERRCGWPVVVFEATPSGCYKALRHVSRGLQRGQRGYDG